VKIRDFLPVLLLAFVFMITVAVAQEDVTLIEDEEVIIEEDEDEEVIIEEDVPAQEEVIIEEAPAPAEEEMMEEEIVPEEETIMEEVVEEEVVEEIVEEPTTFAPGWTAKAYINFGPIEPWGDPGTGAMFNMGMRIQGGAQLNIGNWINLPVIFKPLTAEVMVGYGMFNVKEEINSGLYLDGKTNVISVLALGRYDVTDLILQLIGFEYPALGIFGIAGFQYNTQSWDFPNWISNGELREFDSASSFGLNLGLGVKYNLQSLVGKPVEVDLRFTQGVFIMGDVTDQNGDPMASDKYKHTENGLLFGIGYPF